jgi:hypothetical protein
VRVFGDKALHAYHRARIVPLVRSDAGITQRIRVAAVRLARPERGERPSRKEREVTEGNHGFPSVRRAARPERRRAPPYCEVRPVAVSVSGRANCWGSCVEAGDL